MSYLDEPCCLLWGWAVHIIVNERFLKSKGYPYIGSRDINLGFTDVTAAGKAIATLEEMGFRKLPFRFFKEIHSETMRELSQKEAGTQLHNIFPMYVDIIVSKTGHLAKRALGFMPIDEPLLRFAFGNNCRKPALFGKKIIVPSPKLLAAMKMRSIEHRDKDHKRLKDLCDLTALFLYSGTNLHSLRKGILEFCNYKQIVKGLNVIAKEDIIKASNVLSVESGIIIELIDRIREKGN